VLSNSVIDKAVEGLEMIIELGKGIAKLRDAFLVSVLGSLTAAQLLHQQAAGGKTSIVASLHLLHTIPS